MSKYDNNKTVKIGLAVIQSAKVKIDASENPNIEASEKMQKILDRYDVSDEENSID
jgi:hypothetical protein